jgi:DNA primase
MLALEEEPPKARATHAEAGEEWGSFSEQLKAMASLPGWVGRTVRLLRDGDRFMGVCPFHQEKSPSLKVWPDHYFCFGCGARGDVFTWVQEKGLADDFRGALLVVAADLNVTPPRTLLPMWQRRSPTGAS